MPITDYEIKMAILEMLSSKRSLNKFNLLGRPPLEGALERRLNITFSAEERALAGISFEQLKQSGLIRPTYTDFVNPEDWVEITDAGRRALEQRALDDLDAALRLVNIALCELRHGATSALVSGQPDSIRQAAHSMRELIRQVLDILAPLEDVRAQPNFQPSTESDSGVTRKMRIRYILRNRVAGFSASEADIAETLCQLIDKLYGTLSAEAHRDIREDQRDVRDIIELTETALRRLLL